MQQLQVVPAFGGFLSLFYLFLTYRVIGHRRDNKISLGIKQDAQLEEKVRAHGNFAEYVPIALILISFLELSGEYPKVLIQILCSALTLGRLFHFFGLSNKPTESDLFYRVLGMILTLTTIAFSASLNVYSFIRSAI